MQNNVAQLLYNAIRFDYNCDIVFSIHSVYDPIALFVKKSRGFTPRF